MKVVIDIETNSLVKPTQIWVIVCKDIDTGERHIFRNVTSDRESLNNFLNFAQSVDLFIGHNILGYDYPVINDLTGFTIPDCWEKCRDTLIVSRMVDYPRKKHSIEAYGQDFGLEKVKFNDFKQWSQELEDYCIIDVEICHRVYLKYLSIINSDQWQSSITTEHQFQLVVNDLHNNGFSFNSKKAQSLLDNVQVKLAELDEDIIKSFPPKLKLVREVQPRLTKHGTLNRNDFRFLQDGDLSSYNGGSFSLCDWVVFNPASHKQVIDVLCDAGWAPVDKTKTHIDAERTVNRLKYQKQKTEAVDVAIQKCYTDLLRLGKYGFRINETNLSTLPPTAPSPARSLAKRILYESRRRTLTEWLGLVHPDTGRIHGDFQGIGTWTHRMAHQKPNTANIPNEFRTDGSRQLLGKEMRSLWQAPRNRLLVGVDAEGIQLRIFAHYIDEPEFTKALVEGKKEDKSDPHSLNQRILGDVCKTRQVAKRFIYALLLGGGLGKLAQILDTSKDEAESALARLMDRYQGFTRFKREVIPSDGRRGWFTGLDGRKVAIPGDTASERSHLCMSGYLQNGEAIVMKKATLKWNALLKQDKSILVNFVHDEWQTETPNNIETAIKIARLQSDSLRVVGEELNLKCPLAGSYWNEDHKDYTIGTNWSVTH